MTSESLAARLTSLQRRAPKGMLLGLDRVEEALAQVGDPHVGLRVVHVAGSNGKGSVSAMVEAIARAAGVKTGLYTSPHLCRFAERMRIGGEPIEDSAFAKALGVVEDGCHERLTLFEMLTVAAFVAFREAAVDLAVLEAGLGGRLDATNVVKDPVVTAVTSIALEHVEWLGDTIEKIAREKAGILKKGVPAIVGRVDAEAMRAIEAVAAEVGAGPVLRVGQEIRIHEEGNEVVIGGHERASVRTQVGLAGAHQAENAAVAAGIAWQIAALWPAIEGAIARGIADVRWPGRFERIDRGGVRVILDCAHNLHGVEALAAALRREGIEPSKTALVFGALADKAWPEMLRALAGFASRRYYAEPKGRAPAPLGELAQVAAGEAVAEPREAIARAMAESRGGETVVVAGSIYMVGEVRAALLGIEADPVIAL